MALRVLVTALCARGVFSLANAEPQITPAAQLEPRATDPLFVGYISTNGGFTDARSCDYTATISTSGSYVQCCPTTGACPFFTACSSNTLLAAGTSVPCDYNPTQTCNTGIVLASAGATAGASYVACWQSTLSNPFTLVQNIGSATVAPATSTGSGSSSSSSASSRSGQTSGASSTTSSRASSTTSATTSTSNAAATAGVGTVLSGGMAGILALAQALL